MLQCIHEADLSFCRWEVTVMAKSGWALTCALSDRALGRRQVARLSSHRAKFEWDDRSKRPILPHARILATLRSATVKLLSVK